MVTSLLTSLTVSMDVGVVLKIIRGALVDKIRISIDMNTMMYFEILYMST